MYPTFGAKNLSKYDGQEISFVISEFNPRKRRIIGDRKQLLVAEKAEKQKELLSRISAGMTVEGKVKKMSRISVHLSIWAALTACSIFPKCPGTVWSNPKKLFKGWPDTHHVLIKEIQGDQDRIKSEIPDDTNPWLTAS